MEEKRARVPVAPAHAPTPPAIELMTRARRRLEAEQGAAMQMLVDPDLARLRARLRRSINMVADLSQKRINAMQWLEIEWQSISDDQGLPAVRQGLRKLEEDLAIEGGQIVSLEDAIAKFGPVQRPQLPASSSGPRSFGPGHRQQELDGVSVTTVESYQIEEL